MSDHSDIESLLHEGRTFPPTDGARRSAEVSSLDAYRAMHERAVADPDAFWGEQAERLRWMKPWTTTLEWEAPDARWFVGGRINACDNCVDRHVDEGHGDEVALIPPVAGG